MSFRASFKEGASNLSKGVYDTLMFSYMGAPKNRRGPI